jgi:hypothetical protein
VSRVRVDDLRVGLKLHYYSIKRDAPVEMTLTGKTPEGKWIIQSDLLGIEVEATDAEVLENAELAPRQENA